jgi:tetratricopeptide (TPR) repeat protein
MNQITHRGIEKYKLYLGPRYQTFKAAFDAFIKMNGKVIVELGTSRSFVPAGVDGTAVNDPKYWDVHAPAKWDWGAGIFTRMCAMHLEEYAPIIHTVDRSHNAIDICKVITGDYAHLISYHVMKSEDFLKGFNGKIDLLYMDTGESGEQADQLHLNEAKIIISRDLLSENAIILIDDVNIPGDKESKGKYSIPYLCDNGFQITMLQYQVMLQRSANNEIISHEDLFVRANTCFEKGDYESAVQIYGQLLFQRPGNISILNNLCAANFQLNKIIDSIDLLNQLVQHAPNNGMAWNNLGKMYREIGQIDLALTCFDKALFNMGNLDTIVSNRLFALNYCVNLSPEQISHAHFQWGASKNVNIEHYKKLRKSPIRIGYVSPDFSGHAVSFFIRPILTNHDHYQFNIYCYANVAAPDKITYDFQSMNVKWRDIYGKSDTSVIAQIKKDKIDILVDLAGHTHNNRLSIFAHKPVPVQVTYLGYPNTTGLQVIDYRFTDAIADPPSSQQFYTEKLVYLNPCFLCYEAHKNAPKPEQKKSKKITFGSFNNVGKMNPHVVQIWAKILRKMPDACLLLKSKVLTDTKTQQFVMNAFKKYDINPDQLEFSGYINDYNAHLEMYHKVDIALDTFPYNGTTTTFESLWMGVPVITLEGNTHASRVGKSILTSLGLNDFIASSESAYISKAIKLAKNKPLLNELRYALHNMLKQSKLMDAKLFVKQIEDNYRSLSGPSIL